MVRSEDLELMDTVRRAEECDDPRLATELLGTLAAQVRIAIEERYIAAGSYGELLDAMGEGE